MAARIHEAAELIGNESLLKDASLARPPPKQANGTVWGIRRGTIFRVLALTLAVILLASWQRGWFSPEKWSVPLRYEWDALQVLGWIKAASEFDFPPLLSKINHRLGAPYEANWNDYPFYEEILIFLLGMAARVIGLIPASNLGVLLSCLTSTLAFYACCRLLRHQRMWAFASAILFGFTFYNSLRGLDHLFLSFSYIVPFGLLVSWLMLGSRRMRVGGKWFWICVVTSVVIGLSNPYSLNIFLQLLCLSIAVHWYQHHDKTRLTVGLLCVVTALLAFSLVNLDWLVYSHLHGMNWDAIPRDYVADEIFALKPMEMILPPPWNRLEFLAQFSGKYERLTPIKGDLFSPYLGFVAILALVWMCLEFVCRIARRDGRKVPAYTAQVLWVVAYSVVGGVNCLLGLGGFHLFRSASRYSIFISALCLLFLTSRMSWLTRNWNPAFRWVVAAAILAAGLFDQMPPPPSREYKSALARLIANDTAFGRALETALPAHARVFQFPVMRFPEAKAIGEVQSYEMLRPYLFTKTLHFSFGSNQGRPRDEWQFSVQKLPPRQMVAQLEKLGFSAIYVNRRGFEDRGEELFKSLVALGKTRVVADVIGEQFCVLLDPWPKPQLPETDRDALVTHQRGWIYQDHAHDRERHWSGSDASLTFFSEQSKPARYRVRGSIGTLSPRRVVVHYAGMEVWSAQLSANQMTNMTFSINGKPRYNELKFTTDEPPAPPNASFPMPLAFTAINVRATLETAGK